MLWKLLFHGFKHSGPASSWSLPKYRLTYKSVLGLIILVGFGGVFCLGIFLVVFLVFVLFWVFWVFLRGGGFWFLVLLFLGFLSTTQIEDYVIAANILILWTGIFERPWVHKLLRLNFDLTVFQSTARAHLNRAPTCNFHSLVGSRLLSSHST